MDYEKYITDDSLKQFVWNNLHTSPSPSPNCIRRGCTGIQSINIFGIEHKSVCGCVGVSIQNPNGAELENIMKLVIIIKQLINDYATAN
jgi:hypothetical protein